MTGHALSVGSRVLVVEGISKGATGTVLHEHGRSPRGIRFWRIDLDGIRERTIRQDFLKPLPNEMTPEQRAHHRQWKALALCHGWNELAKKAQTLGEKVYCRIARDVAEKAFVEAGGRHFIERGAPVLELAAGPPRVQFTTEDIELMRAAVKAHDDALAAASKDEPVHRVGGDGGPK